MIGCPALNGTVDRGRKRFQTGIWLFGPDTEVTRSLVYGSEMLSKIGFGALMGLVGGKAAPPLRNASGPRKRRGREGPRRKVRRALLALRAARGRSFRPMAANVVGVPAASRTGCLDDVG
jgi:hypothetical protein